MEIFLLPFPSHFSHITHTFVAHSRQHFSCEAQLFFMPHQTGAHTTRQGVVGVQGCQMFTRLCWKTILANGRTASTLQQMSCVSVKRIGKQARSPWRRKGNVNTSSSVKWVVSAVSVCDSGVGVCECVWARGSGYAMCLTFEWDTTLASLIFLSSPCPDPHFHAHLTDVYKWATLGIARFDLRWLVGGAGKPMRLKPATCLPSWWCNSFKTSYWET